MFDKAVSLLTKIPKVVNIISDLADKGSDYIDKSVPGCTSIPPKAKHVYVYFTIPRSDSLNQYVVGYRLNEIADICEQYREGDFEYFIITSADTQDYGIPYIGSGTYMYDQYRNMEASDLYKYRRDNPKWTVIASSKDVELLRYRMDMLSVGKVFTKAELDAYVDIYKNLMAHLRYGDDAAIHQCILDLALGFCKRTSY